MTQGAFSYFGAVNEPFLLAFRPPRLVAELMVAEVPFVAALRQGEFSFWLSLAAGLPRRPALSPAERGGLARSFRRQRIGSTPDPPAHRRHAMAAELAR